MTKLTREARRGPRFRHDSVLEILDDSDRVMAVVARLVDLSSVGVSFSTTHVFAKGARIRARLRLLSAGVLTVTGRVVRIKEKTNSTLYAVEFESVRGARP
ncbi:MAG: PilZ domain-containing protein [Elusimicrobiota bacterium]